MKLKSIRKNTDKKFIKLYTATYTKNNQEFPYFFVSRNSRENLAIHMDKPKTNAIIAYTFIRESGGPKAVMIKQFRPALNKVITSFCAGLIDGNESPDEALIREVKEELGGTVKSIKWCSGNAMPTSAGLSDECNMLAVVELESLGQQELEASEEIEVVKYGYGDLKSLLSSDESLLSIPGYLGVVLLLQEFIRIYQEENRTIGGHI